MISILGIVIVLGAIVGGYLIEHGKLLVLLQPAELIIIFGAAVGTVVVANPVATLMRILKGGAATIGIPDRTGKVLVASPAGQADHHFWSGRGPRRGRQSSGPPHADSERGGR